MKSIRHKIIRPGMACPVMILFFLAMMAGCHRDNYSGSQRRDDPDKNVYTDISGDGNQSFTYRLDSPEHKVLLPPVLREISGIAALDTIRLAGIQDEEGRVFMFRISNGMIEQTIPFSEDGDFEDLAIVDDTIYVLKSNGTVYSIKQYDNAKPSVTKFKTRLTSRNDCEGLCYVPDLKCLLIVCKGSPSLKKEKQPANFRTVYKFIPEISDIDTVPFISINIEELVSKEPLDWYQGISTRMASRLSQNGNIVFQPSGIAIHPFTGNLYILAHVGKMILITDKRGSILGRLTIDPALLPQPEGICFDEGGVLFIASEGVEADAVLALYRPEIVTH